MKINNLLKSLIGFSLYLLIATATSPEKRQRVETDKNNLAFIGRVENTSDSFTNSKFVLLYKNGKEIRRDTIDDTPRVVRNRHE